MARRGVFLHFVSPYAIDATCLTPNARREDYLGLIEVVTRPGFEQVLFVEMGWGADQHGQNATKACVRAARNAIESTLCGNQPVS